MYMDKFLKPRMILVDHDVEVLQSLEKIFNQECEVIAFYDPEKAIEFTKLTTIQIIICAMDMVNISGYEILEQVKNYQPNARRILLTADSDITEIINGINKSIFHKYIIKPWDIDNLKEVVKDSIKTIGLQIENELLNDELSATNIELKRVNEELNNQVLDQTISINDKISKLKNSLKHQRSQLQHFIGMISLISATHRKEHHNQDMRIARQCRLLGHNLGLLKTDITYLYLAAQLYALGEISLPESLLNKPISQLSKKELNELYSQSTIGADILHVVPSLNIISDALRFQYEHFDGNGYPGVKKGKDIPLFSRILAVVRDYDYYISGCMEEECIQPQQALTKLMSYKNTIYDPDILTQFDNLFNNIPSGSDTEFCYSLDMLKPGMIIAEDVKLANGNVLITQSTTLTQSLIERMEHYEFEHNFSFLVFIFMPEKQDSKEC